MPVCKACDTGTMGPTRVYRSGVVVAAMGYVLIVSAVLGVLLGIYMYVDTNTGRASSGDVNVAAMGAGCAGILVLGSLVGGLLGLVFIRKKTLLECDNCGAVVAES